MKNNSNIRVQSAVTSRYGFNGYREEASKFWMSDSFDFGYRDNDRTDITKLAATQRAIGNFVNIVTGRQIPVVFSKRSGDSYTDGNHVVIGTKLDGKNFDPAVGLALHEGSHIAYTNFGLFKNKQGYSVSRLSDTLMANIVRLNGLDPDLVMKESEFAIIKDLLNWIEDRRIDYMMYNNAPGYRVYYEAMYDKYFNDKIIDKALKLNVKSDENYECYMFHIINFTNPNRKLNALKKLRDVWNLIDLPRINRLQNTEDALVLSCGVYRIIRDAVNDSSKLQEAIDKQKKFLNGEVDEEKPDMDDEGNKSKSEFGDSNSFPSDRSQSKGNELTDDDMDGEDAADEWEDADDDLDMPSVSDAAAEQTAEELLSDKDAKKLDNAIQKQKSFLSGDTKKDGSLTKQEASLVEAVRESGTEVVSVATGAGNSALVDTIVVKKLTAGIICTLPELFSHGADDVINGRVDLTGNGNAANRWNNRQQIVMKGILLGKQLGSKLQIRNEARTLKTTRLQNGKIDRRLVSQLGYDNANVFHKIVTDKFKNYFIHISIDASGSMEGGKFDKALISAIAIAQAASMTTGIRVQISLRGTSIRFGGKGDRCVTIMAYDSATDKINKIRTYFKFLAVFGCTPEGVAFKSIEKLIQTTGKQDEIIFINYSDGAPTSVNGMHTNPADFTRKTMNDFRELGFNIISYFVYDYAPANSTKQLFTHMYGPDASFIQPENMIDVAKTMNSKFLETAK
jgi:hypothetical protein